MSITVDYLIATPTELERMQRETLQKSARKFGDFKCKQPQGNLNKYV